MPPDLNQATFASKKSLVECTDALENTVRRRVHFYHHPDVGDHHFGPKHPMKPHRLSVTLDLVLSYGLHKRMKMYAPTEASREEVAQFHAEDYLDFLSKVTPENETQFADQFSKFNLGIGMDCPIFDGMWDFCCMYAGGSLEGARRLCLGAGAGGQHSSKHQRADICVNWSGGLHHAKKSEASGFCYVNDINLAILELLRFFPRVLYIDIDVHHGDGVQEAFYHTDRVFSLSFHLYNGEFFPQTGTLQEIGMDEGKYYALNVPLREGVDDETYKYLFRSIVDATITSYRPSVIVLQCGADSLACDRLGLFNLSIKGHGDCVQFVKSYDIPLLVLGGGGYTLKNVARCWTHETAVLCGRRLPNELPTSTSFYDYFAPNFELHPGIVKKSEMSMSREEVESIRREALENLRVIRGRWRGVGMIESCDSFLKNVNFSNTLPQDKDTRQNKEEYLNGWYDDE